MANGTKVEIDTPGVTIRVESADNDLETVAGHALDLFKAAGGWPQPESKIGAAGFVSSERRESDDAHPSSLGSWTPTVGVGQ